MLSHFDPDHAADRPRGGEQSADQHGWRRHISEIPPWLLCTQPAFPSRAGRLDSCLQPWSEGMRPFQSWVLCHVTLSYQRTQGCHYALHQCYINSLQQCFSNNKATEWEKIMMAPKDIWTAQHGDGKSQSIRRLICCDIKFKQILLLPTQLMHAWEIWSSMTINIFACLLDF